MRLHGRVPPSRSEIATWAGAATLEPGWELLSGREGDNQPHRHPALQLIVDDDQPVHEDVTGCLARFVESRCEAFASARADLSWAGWTWKPTREELQAYVRKFESERLGRMDVRLGADGLEARLGAMRLRLQLTPAREGVVAAREPEIEVPQTLEYEAEALRWREQQFKRVSP